MPKFLDEIIDDIAYPLLATGTHNNIGETAYNMIGRSAKATTSYKVATDSDLSDVASAISVVDSKVNSDTSHISDVASAVSANSSAISSVASSASVADNAISSTVSSTASTVAVHTSEIASLASGGGGGGGTDPVIAAEVPDITDGTSFTSAQLDYWRSSLTSFNATSTSWVDSGGTAVDISSAPTESDAYNDQGGFPTGDNRIMAYAVRWKVPAWKDQPAYGPGIRHLELDYAVEAQPILDTLRIKTYGGKIYNKYKLLTDGSKVDPSTEILNVSQNLTSTPVTIIITSPKGDDVTTVHHDISFEDGKVNYNNLIPQVYLVAYGDYTATYNNGIYTVKIGSAGGYYAAVYVGTFLSPYVCDTYKNYNYRYKIVQPTSKYDSPDIRVNVLGNIINVSNQVKYV